MYDNRHDKLVSHWIVIYAYFYYFRLVPWNPLLLLIMAYGFTVISSVYIYFHTQDYVRLYAYIAFNSLYKLIPLAMIYNRRFDYDDVIFTWIFMLIYFLYMYFLNENVICAYRDLITWVMNEHQRPQ